MKLPEYVKILLEKLENAGYDAYAVGGCVRDSLLGLSPKDYDIASSALPEQVKQTLSEYKIIDTGLKHGTVTVLADGNTVEITTFRIDGEYIDGRRPESVSFASGIEDDLARRDLTINAFAFSDKTGLIDNFGGRSDLDKRIIKAVGEPEKRFDEDALRILRALRFAAVYDFSVEENTAAAIHIKKSLLRNISGERIASELNKLICGKCDIILRDFFDVFAIIIPQINDCKGFLQHSKYHDRDVLEHIIASVAAVEPVTHLRLSMLFHDLGKPTCFSLENGTGHFKGHSHVSADIADDVMTRLHYDCDTKRKVVFLVKHHDMPLQNDRRLIKRWLNKYGKEPFFDLIKVHIADDSAKAKAYQERIQIYHDIIKTANEIIANEECITLKKLAVNGTHLLEMGISGKKIGETLIFLLNAVIDEKCINEYSELKKYLEDNKI